MYLTISVIQIPLLTPVFELWNPYVHADLIANSCQSCSIAYSWEQYNDLFLMKHFFLLLKTFLLFFYYFLHNFFFFYFFLLYLRIIFLSCIVLKIILFEKKKNLKHQHSFFKCIKIFLFKLLKQLLKRRMKNFTVFFQKQGIKIFPNSHSSLFSKTLNTH